MGIDTEISRLELILVVATYQGVGLSKLGVGFVDDGAKEFDSAARVIPGFVVKWRDGFVVAGL